ncbi:MAG: hypothetical protein RL026_406 [Pseudomonadota bacterium]
MKHPRAVRLGRPSVAPQRVPATPAAAPLQAVQALQASLPWDEPGAGGRELWAAVRLPADGAVQAVATQWCAFSPRVSLEPPDAVLCEVGASQRLFGGLRTLWEALQQGLPAGACLSAAPTPLAALALARAGRSACLTDPARLVGRLAPLPLASLDWPAESLQRLSAMGVHTIGEALRLPREGFTRRFGSGLQRSLDRLVGRAADPRRALAPPEYFHERIDLSWEWPDKPSLLRSVQPALAALQVFLQGRQSGITRLGLQLQHRDHPATRWVLRLAQPEYRAARLTALLELRLGQWYLPAPVRAIELRSGRLRPCVVSSESLWKPGEHGGAGSTAVPAFIEVLQARLGQAAVQGLQLQAGYCPERLSMVRELAATGTAPLPAGVWPAQWTAGLHPLWLLPEPSRLAAMAVEPGLPLWHGRPLQLLAGPERIETGGWEGAPAIARDYYTAMDGEGVRLWVYRERQAGGGWYLHGYFG